MFAIPEGGAAGQRAEDRRVKVAELQAVFRNTGFPFHMVPLEQVSVSESLSSGSSRLLYSLPIRLGCRLQATRNFRKSKRSTYNQCSIVLNC